MDASENLDEERSSDELTELSRHELQNSVANEPSRQLTVEPSTTSQKIEGFTVFLRNTVPTAFIPSPLFNFLYREANERIAMARTQGVNIADLIIGEDCLPTWPLLHWDPDAEALHASIQNRLIDFDVSRDLGDLIRQDIIAKGNMKLAEARELHVEIHDIAIGSNLLPIWGSELSIELEEQQLVVEEDESDTMMSQQDHNSLTALSEVTIITPLTDVFDNRSVCAPRYSSPSSTCDSDDSSEFDDVIELHNLVALQPTYEEEQEEEEVAGRNIVHNVDMVGGAAGSSEVDLEVYLVDNDEDIAELPEAELAIDREAFEYYFGDDGAVDVDVEGMQVFCFAGIEEPASDIDEQGMSLDTPSGQPKVQPLPLFDKADLEVDTHAALGTINEVDDSSEHSEEITADEQLSDEEHQDTE